MTSRSYRAIAYMDPEYVPDWERDDPERAMTPFSVFLPANPPSWDKSQGFVKHAAESGTLWHWEGTEITHPTQMSEMYWD
jgi:hypothetical protein